MLWYEADWTEKRKKKKTFKKIDNKGLFRKTGTDNKQKDKKERKKTNKKSKNTNNNSVTACLMWNQDI